MLGNNIAEWTGGKGCSNSGSKQKMCLAVPEYFYFLAEQRHMDPAAEPWDHVAVFTSLESFSLPFTAISWNLHTIIALMFVWQSSIKRSECNTFQTLSHLKSHRWETSHLFASPLWLPQLSRCPCITGMRVGKWNQIIMRMTAHSAWRHCQG